MKKILFGMLMILCAGNSYAQEKNKIILLCDIDNLKKI